MGFPQAFFDLQLRPVLLCVTGISAVAATSFLVYRWRTRDRQQTEDEAATRTEPSERLEDREPYPSDQDTLETPRSLIPKPNQALHRANRMFAYTISRQYFAESKMVEVKLQHKSLYRGLESEHWWVLSNDFYNVHNEHTLQSYANVIAAACIKCIGTGIAEAMIYLCTESTSSSVQNVVLQTSMSSTFKGVSIDSDGHFTSSESSHIHTIETPNPTGFSTGIRPPRGPPPGF